ncbi:cytochrome P450 3A30-like isoform X3 [Clupea harengus]|uniref:Cytochrome P450 3A n=1 Tax=Clupea harengus TaxID=7950 RepID=A0A6P8F5L1_CLUHA|nr:cytochrome P450 3A30-like isoform X3 [Clupea harengus]XP_031418413.1 cytochrome P450 3A30-like isoform X3 [Clupea harengus]
MLSYLPFLSTQTWTLLLLFLGLLVVYGYWPYGVFKKLGIPGPKPVLFFGNMLNYTKGFHNFDLECFQKYGKMWGIYEGRQPIIFITDTELIKTILVKECYSIFTNRRDIGLNGPLHDAVSVAEDEDWKRIRSVLSPSFTSGRLKEMFGIMKTHSRNLVNSMKKDADLAKASDTKEYFGAYSMDVVTSTAFSVDIDSLNNPKDPFVTNIKKMLKFDFLNPLFLIVAFFPFMTPILEKMNFAFFPISVTDFFYAALQTIKAERVTNSSKNRVDFLQLMVDSQAPQKEENGSGDGTNKGLSDHEILSQAMIFIFAGYETSSATMNFLFYLLATNPDTLKILHDEIDEVFPDKAEVQYEALMQMEYLDCVINETLRLYPPAARLERVCKKTVEISGVIYPKGIVVTVPTYALHRDPELWTEPENFKPERFNKENKETINPYSYMPFGMGPRNCIGMRFALISIKLAIVELLQRFTITTCAETEIPLELDSLGLLAPMRPIKLQLVPRSSGAQLNPGG